MKPEPTSLQAAILYFANPDNCIDYVAIRRWPNGVICPTCGATVHYSIDGRGEFVAVPVGAFAEPSFPAPAFSVYEERKHAWVSLPENIEHMA